MVKKKAHNALLFLCGCSAIISGISTAFSSAQFADIYIKSALAIFGGLTLIYGFATLMFFGKETKR